MVPGGGRSPNWCRGDPEPASYTLSPASALACSDGGKIATITMKGWKWQDGETVDAADVAFWINTEKSDGEHHSQGAH